MKKLAARILGIFFAFAFSFLVVAMTGPLLISSLDSSQGGRVSAATLPAPALVSPANGEAVTGGSVSFVWEAVEGAVDYKLVVSTSTKILDTTKYKCNVNTGGGDVTSYVDAGYLGNGMKYYWWVWAYAADGSYSDWSEVSANGRWFTNPPIQIGAPALISPGLGEAVSGGSIAFQWNAVEGAVDYLLVVSKSTRPLDTKTQKSAIRVGNVTGYTDTGYPANGTKYYWWVWAYNPSGVQSAWSEVSANGRWFTSLPIQIGAPALRSPGNGEALSGSSVLFQWNAVEGAVDYVLIVSRSERPLDPVTNKLAIRVGNVTGYTDTGYPGNGTKYYWWVWAVSTSGVQSAWSEVSANGGWFTNPPIVIGAPALISPGDGGAVAGSSVTYEWNAVEGAVDYVLIVSRSERPLDPVTNKLAIRVGNVTGYTDTGYPGNGTKYYWWVLAVSTSGVQSAWSEVSANGRSFTSAASYIGAPVLVSPDGDSGAAAFVHFSWDGAEGAVDYRLLVSTSSSILDDTKYKLNVIVGNVTSYDDTGYLMDGTTKYYWWVWAYDADGHSSVWSEVVANGLWFRIHPECGWYQWDASTPNYNASAVIHEGTIDYSDLDMADFIGVSPIQLGSTLYADWGETSGWDFPKKEGGFVGDGNTNGDFLDGRIIVLGLNAEMNGTGNMQGWWDLGRETDRVVVFGGIDHAEVLNHPLHYRIYGSDTLWGDELGPLATITEIYLDGWRPYDPAIDTNGDCWQVDDGVAVFSLGGQYRYLKMERWSSRGGQRDPEIDAIAVFPPDAVDLEKLVNEQDADSAPGPEVVVGSDVTFKFVVTNTGTVDLTNVVVTDSVLGYIGTIPILAVGASETLTVAAVAAEGQHANTATVTTDEGASDTDAGHYFGGAAPKIDLEKLVNGEDADSSTGPVVAVGFTVTFDFVVTNTGTVDLTNVVVTDSVLGYIGTIESLGAGASQTLTATAVAEAGQHINTGSVTTDQGVSDTDPGYYFGTGPAVDLEKLVNGEDADDPTGPVVPIGYTVTFDFVVTNTGIVDLTNVVVTDSVLGYIGTIESLAAGASQTLTATAVAEAGQHTNTGSVTTDQGVSDTDPGYYFGTGPAVDLEKLVNGEDADDPMGPVVLVGSTVTFEFAVTNRGDVDLTNVVVTDSVLGHIGTIESLAAGASQTLTATAVAEAGQHTNTGSVTTDQGVSDTDPGYYFGAEPVDPIPDLPTVVLLGVGLVGVAGVMGLSLLRRRRQT